MLSIRTTAIVVLVAPIHGCPCSIIHCPASLTDVADIKAEMVKLARAGKGWQGGVEVCHVQMPMRVLRQCLRFALYLLGDHGQPGV